jgi:hypothetical protein
MPRGESEARRPEPGETGPFFMALPRGPIDPARIVRNRGAKRVDPAQIQTIYTLLHTIRDVLLPQ